MQLKNLIESIKKWENAFQKAHQAGDEIAKQQAEHQRSEYTKAREALMLFKTPNAKSVVQICAA